MTRPSITYLHPILCALTSMVLCGWLLPAAFAAPGDLDATFGTGGKVTTAIGSSEDRGLSVAVQSDGKIVVAGHVRSGGGGDAFALVRYNASGALDTGFGTGGKVVTPIGGGQDYGTSVAVQGDGKIVVVGYSFNGSNNDFAVVRYTDTGALDTGFGTGGKVTTAVGIGDDAAYGVVIQGDGKIVVVGDSRNGSSSDIAVVRYTDTGALDTGFGTAGKVTTSIGSGDDGASGVALQADGKIVVTGTWVDGSLNYRFALVRYTDTGALDTGFGTGGKVTTAIGASRDVAFGVAVQSDGKIVVGGYATDDGFIESFALVRYTDTGALDTSFGTGGKVTTPIGVNGGDASGLALQRDGKIVAAGFASNGANYDFALVRYMETGALDTTFGAGGKVITPIGTGADRGLGMVLQGDGNIVVAGFSSNGTDDDVAVARYLAELPGSVDALDASIGGGSIVWSTVTQPDGKIIIGGDFTSVLGVPRSKIARLNADGTLDTGFDPNANDAVFCVTVQPDGKLLIGGYFTSLQPNGAPAPTARNYVARLNADGTLDTGFDPNANASVLCLTLQGDGKVLIGGDFTTLQPNGAVASTTRNRIARLNADGTLDTGFDPNANAEVAGIALQADGKVLMGGQFTSLQPNGAAALTGRGRVARLNADGTLDLSFDPNADNVIYAVAVQADGKILLTGEFGQLQPNGAVSPTSRERVARVNVDGSLDASFVPPTFAGSSANSLAIQVDGKVLIGSFYTGVVRLNNDGTLDTNFAPGANGGVASVALQPDGKVLLGGLFDTLQPNGMGSATIRRKFARLFNDPAMQVLSAPDAAQVLWQRSGAAPEVSQVTVELSTDGGAQWNLLGVAARIGATTDWKLSNLTLPSTGLLRARGRTTGGDANGSSGLIEQVAAFGAVPTTVINTGGTAIAADLPTGTQFLSFTAPDIGVGGGRIMTPEGRKLDAVFNEQGVVLLHEEQMVRVDPAGGGAMGAIDRLMPPTGDAVVAMLGRGAGVTGANDQVLFTGLQGGAPVAAAREGQDVPEVPNTAMGTLVSVDGNGDVTFFLARLHGKGPGGQDGVGVFAVGPAPTGSRLLVRTGQMVGSKQVKVIATLIGAAGTLAEGRWRGGPRDLGVRLTFTDKTQALYLIPATATGPDDWLLLAQTGGAAGPDLVGAELKSFQLPAYAPGATVFDSLLRIGPGGIVRKKSRAVFDAQGVDTRGPITLRLLAQVAGPAPALSNMQRFLNTLAGLGRASTLIANATLPGESASRGTIFDARQDGELRPIARLGGLAPGGGRFDRFVSVAKPDGQGYGALVSALLKTDRRAGITPKNRAALFARDSAGELRRILRAGDQLESAGPGSARKAVKSFVALTAAPGSIGAARGYDANGKVNVLVTFADRTQAVVSIQVP